MPRPLSILPQVKVINNLRLAPADKGEEYEESWNNLITLAGPARTNIKRLKEAIREEFRYGCCCEHDCCGHTFGYAYTHTLRRIKSGTWTFRMHHAVNI